MERLKLIKFYLLVLFLTVSCTDASQAQNQENSNQTEQTTITQENAENDEIEYLVTFIELGSVNCVPCKMMQPVMKEIEEEFGDQVKVIFYDVWTEEGQPYGQKYGIRVIPTQVFLDKDGNEYYRHEGFFPKEEIIEILKMQGVE